MAFSWKDGAAAAVSLTFDDGMPCHLDTAIPILDGAELAGTFYVSTRSETHLAQFAPAAAAGHEVGNHSVNHRCSVAGHPDPAARGLQHLTLDEMAAELDESDRRMRAVFPGVTRFSFGYPCYNTFVGVGVNRRSYVPLVAERFVAARSSAELAIACNAPAQADIWCLNSWRCELMAATQLIGIVERTRRLGLWSIFTFHGIGEGHLLVGRSDFQEMVDHLAAVKREVWTAPLIDVAQYVQASRTPD